MKRLLIIGCFPPPLNGQSIATQMVYEGFLKKGYQVNKINTGFSFSIAEKDNQGNFSFKKLFISFFRCFKEFFIILFKRYDVVYMTPGSSFLGFFRFAPYIFICSIKKKSIYLHFHTGAFRKMYDNISSFKKYSIRVFLKRIRGIIVLGESLRKMFEGLIEENKIFICNNGVQYSYIATKEEIIKKLTSIREFKKIRLLYLSNLIKEKGVLDILDAIEYLEKDSYELHLAGAIDPYLKKKINIFLSKNRAIIYHGIVTGSKKKDLLLNSHIFILPSYYKNEGQPVSILEAYANGCAVITDPSTGGIRDIFVDNKNGIACTIKNPKSIARAITTCKGNIRFNENNYNNAIEKYLEPHYVNKLINIIDENYNLASTISLAKKALVSKITAL